MDQDDVNPDYDGSFARVVLERFLGDEWSYEEVETDCAGRPTALVRSARALLVGLREGSYRVTSMAEVIDLMSSGRSWDPYIDPELSVTMSDERICAIMLYECSDHCVLLAGWGREWSLAAHGHEALVSARTLQFREWAGAARNRGTDPSVEKVGRAMEPIVSLEEQLGELFEAWREAGFTAEEALPWATSGLLPFHAQRWSGWDVDEAIDYSLKGLRPAAVLEWTAMHPGESARAWVAQGFQLSAAAEWLAAGYTLVDAVDAAASGVLAPRHLSH